MEETGLENMTENTEKEKVLSKEEIVAALNERHSPEKQKLLSAGRVAIAGLGGLGIKRGICTCKNRSRPSAFD